MFPLRVEKLQTKAGQKAKVKISRTQSMVKQSEKQNSGMKKAHCQDPVLIRVAPMQDFERVYV